jgi:hypothetical protein
MVGKNNPLQIRRVLMQKTRIYRNTAIMAFAAGLMIFILFGADLLTGVSPQSFEIVSHPETYAREIVAAENLLRFFITIDSLFLAFYMTAFVFLAMSLWREGTKPVVAVGLTLLLVTTMLDLQENHDIMTQLTTALAGMPLELEDLQQRMIFSQLKFHSSYLGLFLLAFIMPSGTLMEKLLKYSLLFGYLPIGILVYTFPHPVFEYLRLTFMLSGFAMLSWNSWARYRKAAAPQVGNDRLG